ncbi:seminal metalloprotease 1 [Osmia lignaria lignaria]|uniref:seminal metalloprotease 1 n=1 Tax=Osmia lignaria lignaria TaxID=1437193 RepID=UPI0014782AEA|nr:zinc metalloproteinase nas-13 isoform X1 [Osmia lignaria]
MHRLKSNEMVATFILYIASMEILTISIAIDPDFERAIPPTPKFQGTFDESHAHEIIADRVRSWTEQEKQHLWELSGLYEGDIMLVEGKDLSKNGLVNNAFRWPAGIVPYYIKEEDFDQEDIDLIEAAIKEYHESTCIRFRPFKKTDNDYISIEGKMSGCWSLVGRHVRGQVVNLQNPGCVKHGVIVHELMHAVGFYHQQSAADRDEWVTINWENVKPGKEHNFNKYDNRTVTDYGIGYDYTSVMHYSSHAFSKNGEPTITPKKKEIKLGQRKGLSGKDILKLQEMYKKECGDRDGEGTTGNDDSSDDISIDWIFH